MLASIDVSLYHSSTRAESNLVIVFAVDIVRTAVVVCRRYRLLQGGMRFAAEESSMQMGIRIRCRSTASFGRKSGNTGICLGDIACCSKAVNFPSR